MKSFGPLRRFKYTKRGFKELPVKLKHMTVRLDFADGAVVASNCLEMTSIEEMEEIRLDASDIEIIGVQWCREPDMDGDAIDFTHVEAKNSLTVKLPRLVTAGETFFIRTLSRCVPTENILEGLYKDATPAGAPQQYMSQCQQWGFQRIMPVLDDCRAKCTMTTTIEADAAYTHLISNGDISKESNPDGVPVPKEGDESRKVITYENPIPMSPYLFLVCVGTWECLVDSVTYPSGREVRLEYLVPPGHLDEARIPMAILKESVLWVGSTQGYEYTFDTYRTICMTKSNFGGMENLGNTTIVTDAALITPHTLDAMILYAHAVIVHEFEHNQCGSETTMETPFDVWLNEAYTVDVERQFMLDKFDPAFIRLRQVDSMRAPLAGPLAIEDAGHYGRIVRDGFNEPDELIDGVTYVKAAEVISMLRLLIGSEAFTAAKELYFDRYRYGNANNDQFFACFEEVSGADLGAFKKEWLYRIGYPKLTALTSYDAGASTYRINFTQELDGGTEPFTLPVKLALVDESGSDIEGTAQVFIIDKMEQELLFENIAAAPAIASMNRDASFYGTFEHTNADEEALILQTRLDPNTFNQVDAMRKLTDRLRVGLLEDPGFAISDEWLALYGEILADEKLAPPLKAYFLRIDEQPLDRRYSAWYRELVTARERLVAAVNVRYRAELLKEFGRVGDMASAEDGPGAGIGERALRNLLLELIVSDDSPESHALILDSYRTATTATERVSALGLLNRSSEASRREVLAAVHDEWHTHLSGYANYLRIVGSGTCEDVFEMIEAEKARESFDITQPTWSRAINMSMAANNKMVWTDTGIAWVADSVIHLAPINSSVAGFLLNTFQHVHSLRGDLGPKVTAALERIVAEVSAEVSVSVNGQAKAYLGRRRW